MTRIRFKLPLLSQPSAKGIAGFDIDIGKDGVFKNNILFTGDIYGDPLIFDLQNNAEFKGSAASVDLSNNATLTFDDTAGRGSDSYDFCGGGGNSSVPQES